MKKRIVTSTVALAVLFLVAAVSIVSAYAAEEGDVGCYEADVTWDGSRVLLDITSIDEGVEWASVARYAWIRFDAADEHEFSYENVVSWEVPRGVESIRVCTTYWADTTQLIEAPTVKVETTDKQTVVVTPSVAPHPTLAEAWLTDNGFVVR